MRAHLVTSRALPYCRLVDESEANRLGKEIRALMLAVSDLTEAAVAG